MKIVGFSEELLPMVSFIDENYRSHEIKNKISKMDVIICTAPLTKNLQKTF